MAVTVAKRVQNHRQALHKSGLRPVQLWVPDTRHPDFARECQRQSKLAGEADLADSGLDRLIDHALADVEGWII